MEITRQVADDGIELEIRGRLDGYWADHLAAGIQDVMREGCHRIRLNMSDVTYLSSAGIRVLLEYYKQLKNIHGALVIASPSNQVKKVLDLAGLGILLTSAARPVAEPAAGPTAHRYIETETTAYEVIALSPSSTLMCRAVGRPELLATCCFQREDAQKLECSEDTVAIGLGAFGDDDCERRFGEFLAVTGTAAYLPTDGTGIPDYMVSTGTLVPEVTALYSLACNGRFSHVVRFDAKPEHESVPLSELVAACMDVVGVKCAAIVFVAESAGLVGAALRRSPMRAASEGSPFTHPEVRDWLSFSPDGVFMRSVVIAAGVADETGNDVLAPMLRPLVTDRGLAGHFHAAAFSYRPLRKSQTDLKDTVRSLYEAETLKGLLHLLADNRENAGTRESRFMRGACWVGPIADVTAERN